tara:strand:+ start:8069 stop:8632 length:564 start_codon:yes stop_codon:yes gene_type:complete
VEWLSALEKALARGSFTLPSQTPKATSTFSSQIMRRFLLFWIHAPTHKAGWLAPVGYMVVLQLVTGIPKPEYFEQIDGPEALWEFSKIIYDYPYLLQDLAHFPLFAALAWLWSWYLGGPKAGKWFHGKALAIALAYGIFNECFQLVLPTRFLSTGDLMMNVAGVLSGAWAHGWALRKCSPRPRLTDI